MSRTILFLKTAWANYFDGRPKDKPTGKHSWLQHNLGHESLNFKKQGSYYYGYCPHNGSHGSHGMNRISLERLGGTKEDVYLDGIDVVFIAAGEEGVVVVGWYKNARVYRERQKFRPNRYGYVKATKAYRVPPDARRFVIEQPPRRAAVWYAGGRQDLHKRIASYIDGAYEQGKIARGRRTSRPDTEQMMLVEQSAYDAVISEYESLGYVLISCQRDNKGWDLEARRNGRVLKLEVKGTSGADICAELTPNEYAKALLEEDYRICVVTDALGITKVYVFSRSAAARWFDETGRIELLVKPRTAARLSARPFRIDPT